MYEEGLVCGDPSLSLPYRPSRIPALWIAIYSVAAPLAVILLADLATSRRSWCGALLSIVVNYVIAMAGAVAKYGMTLMAKATWGKLRPHFLDVCRPSWERVNCSTHDGFPRYIPAEELECTGPPDMVAEARESFWSGHACIVVYTSLLCILYMQSRPLEPSSCLAKLYLVVRPVAQYLLVAVAMYVSITRVADNWPTPRTSWQAPSWGEAWPSLYTASFLEKRRGKITWIVNINELHNL